MIALVSGFFFQRAAHASTFTNSAYVLVNDTTNGLSWNPSLQKLTVSCWFKLSVPSGATIPGDMTILVNQASWLPNSQFAYLVRFSVASGNVEFAARGSTDAFTYNLIEKPYLERWYHIAVVRQNDSFIGYVDGRQVFSLPKVIGSSASASSGLSIGGWGGGRFLFGEVQEVAVYQDALLASAIRTRMFNDTPTTLTTLRAYLKLAASTNSANQLTNFAQFQPPGAGLGTVQSISGGQVTFEPTSQSGEQSVYDSRKNSGENAIAPLSGMFTWAQTIFARPTPGIAMDLRVGYFSGNAFSSSKLGEAFNPFENPVLSPGWRHTFEMRVLPGAYFDPSASGAGVLGVMNWDGSIETWDLNLASNQFQTRHKEYRGELTLPDNQTCQWISPERLIYRFAHPNFLYGGTNETMIGRLLEIRDFNSNSVQIVWRENDGIVDQVVDSAGGRYYFNYNGPLLTNITFAAWRLYFTYDGSGRLISKTLTNTSGLYTNAPTTWQFAYSGNLHSTNLLERIIDPRTNTQVLVQYDQYGRQTNQVDALGRASATRYGLPAARQITRIDPGGFQWIESYDRKGRVLTNQDPLLNLTSYSYDTNGNRTSITEPLGYQTFFGYDARANVIARTNQLNQITRWAFHGFFNRATNEVDALGWTNSYELDNTTGNLLRQYDNLGDRVRYTYDLRGLVTNSIDANGNLTRFVYDTNGFLIAQIDAASNTNSFAVNDVGWKLAQTNALLQVATFAYDLNGHVVRTLDPLQRINTATYDGNGNLLAASDAKGLFTAYGYDPANQRTNMVDRTGTNIWRYFYSSRGNLTNIVNPLNFGTTNYFDQANRLVRVSDFLGQGATNVYDANGNIVTNFDKLGQAWVKTYDVLNRVVAESDPLGNTKQTIYDPVGRISQITPPRGFPSLHFYDGRGRLTNWVDAESLSWRYSYDGNGNILDIEDALHGHYVMGYSNRNERVLERNQDNKEWRYRYDQLLRHDQQTDPNGLVRTITYDDGGRIDYVSFSTGRTDDYGYDENNNLILLSRSRPAQPPVSSTFDYDLLDRVTQYTDPAQKKVGYGYDAIGRITTLRYPDGKTLTNSYDALNRLIGQADWANRQLTYNYDRADRLVRRTYPNGVAQTNTFDSAGRLTGLSYSPTNVNPNVINVALTYAYDRNGNKANSTESGTYDWPMPSLHNETSGFTAAGRITNRVDTLNPAGSFAYQFDASGNMTNATSAEQTWRLVYDEDNRVTSLFWTNGVMNDKVITNRYDALGRRIARKQDGDEIRYVLDMAGGMERILCDTTSAGQITAYYIHGPDLCYKVTPGPTETLTCYHADAQANIVSITDSGGTNLIQYAYTPYGRSFSSTNYLQEFTQLSANPYLFVGSQGVMEEVPGLFFMRARYYSAEAGVFVSTDPLKSIGPQWKPVAYAYANGNPLTLYDPTGLVNIPGALNGMARTALGLAGAISGGQMVYGGITLAVGGSESIVPVPIGIGIAVVGANDLYEGSVETVKGVQDIVSAWHNKDTIEPETVGFLKGAFRNGGKAIGISESSSDAAYDIFDTAAGLTSTIGNAKTLDRAFERDLVTDGKLTVSGQLTSKAYSIATSRNAIQEQPTSGPSVHTGTSSGGTDNRCVCAPTVKISLPSNTGSNSGGNRTDPNYRPPNQNQPSNSTSGGFWHSVGNWFSKTFSGGKKK